MADPFRALSSALADRVAAVGPHLLSVRAHPRRSTAVAWAEDLAITTAHTLHRREEVDLRDQDGLEHRARVVGRDPAIDLALLRVDGGLRPATWADTDALRPGELVLSVGRPRRGVKVALGMLSTVGPGWRTRHGVELDRWLEVDGSLPRGLSGGVLVAASGIVGLNTHDLVPGGTTIPAETLARVVGQLLGGGAPGRGYLGVSTVPAAVPPALRDALGAEGGLLLVGLEPGGPAAAAGMLQGDLLVSVDGRNVGTVRGLVGALRGRDGATVEVVLVRAGEVERREVTLGRRS